MLFLLVTVGGCGGLELSSTPATLSETASTTMSPAFLEAVLLSRIDIRGSGEKPDTEDEGKVEGETPASKAASSSAAACVGGLDEDPDPNFVSGPTLLSGEGLIQRSYTSMGTLAPPEEAAAVVGFFSSPEGPRCLLHLLKEAISEGAKSAEGGPVTIDTSGLATSSSAVAVGEGGVLITISGNLRALGVELPSVMEVLAFSKGRAMVIVLAAATPGTPFPVRIVELAQKVEGRLL
jgi:hypothetical protein